MQEDTKQKVEALEDEFSRDPRYQEWKAAQQVLKDAQAAEAEVRTKLLDLGMQNFDGQNRRPIKGVQIKEFRTAIVTDAKKAMAWAARFLPSAIKLDTKAVGKAAENLDVDFIEVQTEFRPNLVEKELGEA